MSASGRRTVIVSVAALAVAVMLVLAATTGPSGLVREQASGPSTSETTQQSQERDQGDEQAAEDQPAADRSGFGQWLHDFLWFALILIGLAVTAAAVRAIALRLTRDLLDKQLVLDLEPLPDVHAGREAVRRDLESYAEALAASDVRNGIVACWVRLEQTASGLGVIRRPAETATEFVVRFLHTLDIDPRPVATLAALYQEARFSTHDLPGDARERAESSLHGIQADLERSATT